MFQVIISYWPNTLSTEVLNILLDINYLFDFLQALDEFYSLESKTMINKI